MKWYWVLCGNIVFHELTVLRMYPYYVLGTRDVPGEIIFCPMNSYRVARYKI